MQSNYLTNPQDWDERLRVMELNLIDGYYDYLYFNIVLAFLDAKDNADYDKAQVFKMMLSACKRGAMNTVLRHIDELKKTL